MGRPPSTGYVVAVTLTAILAIVGVWLPWVRKRPVGYIDGQPYYTEGLLPGLHAGFRDVDPFVVLLAVLVIVAVVAARRWDWSPDGVIIVAGTVLMWWSGTMLGHYRADEHLAVEPGLYLSVLSGIVLVLLGAGTGIRRYLNTKQNSRNANPPPG